MKLTSYLDLEKSCYHICLSGELDACSSILMDEAMDKAIRQQPREIQVDCQSLCYISSAGIGVFVSYLQPLSSKNISLVLHDLNPTVKNTFDVTRLPALVSKTTENTLGLVAHNCLDSTC
jgi:anti-sigma B factor antagonist